MTNVYIRMCIVYNIYWLALNGILMNSRQSKPMSCFYSKVSMSRAYTLYKSYGLKEISNSIRCRTFMFTSKPILAVQTKIHYRVIKNSSVDSHSGKEVRKNVGRYLVIFIGRIFLHNKSKIYYFTFNFSFQNVRKWNEFYKMVHQLAVLSFVLTARLFF